MELLICHFDWNIVGFIEPFKSREERKRQIKLEGARKAGLDLDENGRLIFPGPKYRLQRRPWGSKPSFPPWVPVENLGKSWFENRAKLAEAMEKRRKAREKRQAITNDDAESCISKTGKEPDEKVERDI